MTTEEVEIGAPVEIVPPPPAPAPAPAPAPGAATEDVEEFVVDVGRENTGRWTKQEHAAFLRGIEKYGKEWKRVAGLVKTRTVMQTRTHAQKYYEKLSQVAAKANGTPGKTIIASTSKKYEEPKVKDAVAKKEETKKNVTLKNPPTPFPTPTSQLPLVSFTDMDILVPINDATVSRTANKEYMDMMKANCFIFHSLPVTDQVWFARNLVHFLTTVRGRRWIACNFAYHHTTQYQHLTDPSAMVSSDFRMEPLKVAAFAFHPLWLLGEHDPGNAHNGTPFLHRTVDGTWKAVTTAQVRDVLKGEGPKNLLLLPPTVKLESVAKGEESGSAAAQPAAAAAASEESSPPKKQKTGDEETPVVEKSDGRNGDNEKAEGAETASENAEPQKAETQKAETQKPETEKVETEKVGTEKVETEKPATKEKAVQTVVAKDSAPQNTKDEDESDKKTGKVEPKKIAKDQGKSKTKKKGKDDEPGEPKNKGEGDQGEPMQRRSKRIRM